ncbi:hypothetical protein FACS189473_2490 [Spirochaetia bacterium]|nr:hypothetical protein FACS189473_2490 [Spirochaetia bacterium]
MVNYDELQIKIHEHFERMCDENYNIDLPWTKDGISQNKYEYLWIYLKDDALEYYLWQDREILNKKKSKNEYAIIRLWLDDVELEDEIHYCVDADKAFRLCRENIEQLLNK